MRLPGSFASNVYLILGPGDQYAQERMHDVGSNRRRRVLVLNAVHNSIQVLYVFSSPLLECTLDDDVCA